MVIFPNAKINLGLYVTARRPDGYHNIETVMIPVPSRDILEIVEASDGADSLSCYGRGVECPMEKNLVYKALVAMRQRFDIPPVEIHLDKQTPDGAGLGGGSADAAFALILLNRMFGCGASEDELARIASTIGADCPFFIYNQPMLCTGIGTTMEPFDLQLPGDLWVLLVKPRESVPTKEAYAGLTPHSPAFPLSETLSLPMEQWSGKLINDFEVSVFAKYPSIAVIKEKIREAGAIYASMSGSGSTVFGLFSKELSQEEIKPLCPDGCYLFSKIS